MQVSRFVLSCSAAIGFAVSSMASNVWVVGPTLEAGVDGTDLQTVINFAASGDIVVVRNGAYKPALPVVIQGKGLSLVAEAAASPSLFQALFVQDQAVGQNVLVRGIDFHNATALPSVLVRNSHALVWIDHCDVIPSAALGGHAMRAERADSVLVQDCDLRAQPAKGTNAGCGLDVLLSTVHLRDTLCQGGIGAAGAVAPAGACLSSATLTAVGSWLIGGPGASGSPPPSCSDGGAGGPGALLSGNGSVLQLYSTPVIGGAGGSAVAPCNSGVSGPATQVDSGTVQALGVAAHDSAVNSPVREGQSLVMSFNAPNGELVVLGVSSTQMFLPLPSMIGVLGLGAPLSTFCLGAMPGAGVQSFQVKELGAGIEGVVVYGQAVFVSPQGAAVLGPSLPAVLLDGSI